MSGVGRANGARASQALRKDVAAQLNQPRSRTLAKLRNNDTPSTTAQPKSTKRIKLLDNVRDVLGTRRTVQSEIVTDGDDDNGKLEVCHSVTIEEVDSDDNDNDDEQCASADTHSVLGKRKQTEQGGSTDIVPATTNPCTTTKQLPTIPSCPTQPHEKHTKTLVSDLLHMLLNGSVARTHAPVVTRHWLLHVNERHTIGDFLNALLFAPIQLSYYVNHYLSFFGDAPYLWVPLEFVSDSSKVALQLLLCGADAWSGQRFFGERVCTAVGHCQESFHRFLYNDMLAHLMEKMRVELVRDIGCELMRNALVLRMWDTGQHVLNCELQNVLVALQQERRVNNLRTCTERREQLDYCIFFVLELLYELWQTSMLREVEDYQQRGEAVMRAQHPAAITGTSTPSMRMSHASGPS